MIKFRNNLYLGDLSDAADEKKLMKMKITAVLSVCQEATPNILNLKHVKIGLTDDERNPVYLLRLAVYTLLEMLAAKEKVLVHCAAGISRSPYIIAKFFHAVEGKSIDETYKELKKLNGAICDDSPLRRTCND